MTPTPAQLRRLVELAEKHDTGNGRLTAAEGIEYGALCRAVGPVLARAALAAAERWEAARDSLVDLIAPEAKPTMEDFDVWEWRKRKAETRRRVVRAALDARIPPILAAAEARAEALREAMEKCREIAIDEITMLPSTTSDRQRVAALHKVRETVRAALSAAGSDAGAKADEYGWTPTATKIDAAVVQFSEDAGATAGGADGWFACPGGAAPPDQEALVVTSGVVVKAESVGGKWYCPITGEPFLRVTYWRPLPAPPAEEDHHG
jgi:hypothetical protein